MPEPAICPECRAGKCINCDGEAWDDEADAPTVCACAEAGHDQARLFSPVCPYCGHHTLYRPEGWQGWVRCANPLCESNYPEREKEMR